MGMGNEQGREGHYYTAYYWVEDQFGVINKYPYTEWVISTLEKPK